jgi:alkylated DNA repair protein alkB homolog 1
MSHRDLDPHARPPEKIKDLYKRFQKLKGNALLKDSDLLDLQRDHAALTKIGELSADDLEKTYLAFNHKKLLSLKDTIHPLSIYTHEAMPGNNTVQLILFTLSLYIFLPLVRSSCFRLIYR